MKKITETERLLLIELFHNAADKYLAETYDESKVTCNLRMKYSCSALVMAYDDIEFCFSFRAWLKLVALLIEEGEFFHD